MIHGIKRTVHDCTITDKQGGKDSFYYLSTNLKGSFCDLRTKKITSFEQQTGKRKGEVQNVTMSSQRGTVLLQDP